MSPLEGAAVRRKKRPPGAGWAERTRNGKFRARIPVGDGTIRPLGVFETEEQAHNELDIARYVLATDQMAGVGGMTLIGYGVKFLKRRDLNGHRNSDTDEGRWNLHIATAAFADRPMVAIEPRDIRQWLEALRCKRTANIYGESKPLSHSTIRHCRNLLLKAFDDAMQIDEIVTDNPVKKAKLPPAPATAEETWTYLTPDEQRALINCEKIRKAERLIMAIAIGSGLREGEQWNLEIPDLHMDDPRPWMWIQYGKPNHGPTKTKKSKRRVELFGVALEAMKEWLTILPTYTNRVGKRGAHYGNPLNLVFPTRRGKRRRDKEPIDHHWREYLVAAGIAREEVRGLRRVLTYSHRHDRRPVRWHDLRHTCASSLLCGWWGSPWRLEQIAALLGHKDIRATQMYAHLAGSVIADAAAATPGLPKLNGSSINGAASGTIETCPSDTPQEAHSEAKPSTSGRAVTPEAAGSSPVHPASGIVEDSVAHKKKLRGTSGARLAAAALAFLRDGAAGKPLDTAALADLVDRELGPVIALAEQVAKGGPFAIRRASDLADLLLDLGDVDARDAVTTAIDDPDARKRCTAGGAA